MANVLVALAPIVIAMLRDSGRRGGAGAGATGGTSLTDVLGQILGGGQGSSRLGGLGALLEQLQRAGFADQTRSWVGTGRNLPLPPGALEQAFGRRGLAEIARMAGVSEDDASRGLAELLPEMVDRVTPGGDIPDATALLANVTDLAKRLGIA